MNRRFFLWLVAITALLSLTGEVRAGGEVVPGSANGERVALVVGNAAYIRSPLRNPVNDARAIAAKLESLGFKVIKRENLRAKEIGPTLREFRSRISPGGVALFFYAGHGVQLKGVNYLPTVDADIEAEEDVPTQSFDTNKVVELMDEAKSRVNLVFLDACRDNPFARKFRSAARGLAKIDAASGTLISFATRPGSVAADGEGANGLYTEFLLRYIEEAGVPIEQLLKRVGAGVKLASKGKQEPWSEGLIEGDFYFRLSSGGAQSASVAPPATEYPATSPPRTVVAGEDATKLELAKSHLAKAYDLQLRQNRGHDADTEYRLAYELFGTLGTSKLDEDSKVGLGWIYLGGLGGVAKDPPKALALLKPYAEAGNARSQSVLGAMYANGIGVTKDEREAVNWYRKAAEQGLADAQASLGWMYAAGLGVSQDEREAVNWYRKAADQGNAYGQNGLGWMYAYGLGIAKDEREAVNWYRKAAVQGLSLAQANLGWMYANGLGVGKDEREAVNWFRKAAEQGDENAKAILAKLGVK